MEKPTKDAAKTEPKPYAGWAMTAGLLGLTLACIGLYEALAADPIAPVYGVGGILLIVSNVILRGIGDVLVAVGHGKDNPTDQTHSAE